MKKTITHCSKCGADLPPNHPLKNERQKEKKATRKA